MSGDISQRWYPREVDMHEPPPYPEESLEYDDDEDWLEYDDDEG